MKSWNEEDALTDGSGVSRVLASRYNSSGKSVVGIGAGSDKGMDHFSEPLGGNRGVTGNDGSFGLKLVTVHENLRDRGSLWFFCCHRMFR